MDCFKKNNHDLNMLKKNIDKTVLKNGAFSLLHAGTIDIDILVNTNTYYECLPNKKIDELVSFLNSFEMLSTQITLHKKQLLIDFFESKKERIDEYIIPEIYTEYFEFRSGKIPFPFDFFAYDVSDRSCRCSIHMWEALYPLFLFDFLCLKNNIKTDIFILQILSSVCVWHETGAFLTYIKDTTKEDFVWYDANAGLRAIFLAYILVRLDNSLTREYFSRLTSIARDHLFFLSADKYYTSHSNHGLYQSFGLLCLARSCNFFAFSEYCIEIAEERVIQYISSKISNDGMHLEHSSSYFYFILKILTKSTQNIQFSIKVKKVINTAVKKLAQTLPLFIRPNGKLIDIGDSSSTDFTNSIYNTPYTTQELTLLTDSGYAFVRAGKERQSYLMITSAFHSKVHKHSDDLAILWSEGMQDILIDSGYYGYLGKLDPHDPLKKLGFMYSDPKRIYVESTHAHNTVEINGKSSSRAGKPHGAGNITGSKIENFFTIKAQVPRPEGVLHTRIVCFAPARWLLILDRLESTLKTNHTPKFTQWFHFNPSMTGSQSINNQYIFSNDSISVFVSSLQAITKSSCVKGVTEPRLQGWYCDAYASLAPNEALAFHTEGYDAYFATLFSLGYELKEGVVMLAKQKWIVSFVLSNGETAKFFLPL